MTNENVENWFGGFDKFLNRLVNERPNGLHNAVTSIAEACADQMHDLMPGCTVRVIVDCADFDSHHEPEKVVHGAGISFTTKTSIGKKENEYLLLTTDTND